MRDGSVCVLPRKYWLAQAVYVWETEKGELHSSQQKSPPPDSLVTFKGRCPAAATLPLPLLLLLPRGVAVRVPPSRLP